MRVRIQKEKGATSHMIRPTTVKAVPGYRVYLEFSDGTKGEVDLSDLIDTSVFQALRDPVFFSKAHIGAHREIRWNDEIELCADSLYLRLGGKEPTDLFPALRHEPLNA
jgi:hypothetical protein